MRVTGRIAQHLITPAFCCRQRRQRACLWTSSSGCPRATTRGSSPPRRMVNRRLLCTLLCSLLIPIAAYDVLAIMPKMSYKVIHASSCSNVYCTVRAYNISQLVAQPYKRDYAYDSVRPAHTANACRYNALVFHMQELSEALFNLVTILRDLLNKLPSNAVAIKLREQGHAASTLDAQHSQ